MASYDTNLASEFYVLSCLHRLGMAAALTLGNKKGVDIFVARADGSHATIEVKGVAKRYDWPANNITKTDANHFIVLVCFEGKIGIASMPTPLVWVIPAGELDPFVKEYDASGRRNVSSSLVRKNGEAYKDAWQHIEVMQGDDDNDDSGDEAD